MNRNHNNYDYVYDLVIWEVWKVKAKALFVFQPTGFAHIHPERMESLHQILLI